MSWYREANKGIALGLELLRLLGGYAVLRRAIRREYDALHAQRAEELEALEAEEAALQNHVKAEAERELFALALNISEAEREAAGPLTPRARSILDLLRQRQGPPSPPPPPAPPSNPGGVN